MAGVAGVEAGLARRRDPVDEALLEAVPANQPTVLHDATRHLLAAGGKRLRPVMVLLSAEALAGVDPDTVDYRRVPDVDGRHVDVLAAAVGIEFVQTFTLVHDDLMDNDDVRRGVPAVHRAFDDSMAILAGDVLHARAFELLLGTGASPARSIRALSRVARTCTEICAGQTTDIAFEERTGVTIEEYIEMVEQKTAALFATAVSLPAILLGHEAAVEPLAAYGRDVGRAFQIHDDLLDLTTPTETLGKQRGSDLVEGKRTLVTVHARQQGVDVDGLLGDDATEADIDAAVEVLDEAGSIEFAREHARELVASGKSHLDALPETDARQMLADTADHLIEREY